MVEPDQGPTVLSDPEQQRRRSRGRRCEERELGWKAKTLEPELARIMVEADVEALKHEGSSWIDTPKF